MGILKRHILWVALLVQAALLSYRIDLLPVWGDERYTLETSALPPARILDALRVDVHPPFYYFLVKAWLKLPFPGTDLVRARALSAIVALVATCAFYRLWLAGLPFLNRALFLGLWVFSPCLVLYARMARSYTLQLLLTLVAIRLARDWLRQPSSAGAMARYIVAATVLLYTHYLPGLAVVLGTAAIGLWRRQWMHALAPAVIALAYAPWLGTLIATSGMVARGQPYEVGPNSAVGTAVNLAYAFVAFNFGESIPVWAMAVGAVLLPALACALWMAWQRSPHPPLLFLLVAAIGYIGAARWVTFAFIGARLLFLLPFYLLFLLRGLPLLDPAPGVRRLSRATYAGLLLMACAGLTSYYRKQDFLNKGYLVDFDQIARFIEQRSQTEPALVLLDRQVSEAGYALHRAGFRGRVEVLAAQPNFDRAVMDVRHHQRPLVWFLRYGRDLLPGSHLEHFEADLSRDYQVERFGFVPFSAIDHAAMRALGMRQRPAYMIEVIELRSRGG